MAAKISQLTDNTWIFKGGHEKTGLLIKIENSYKFYSTEGTQRFFSDFSKVEKYFGKLKDEGSKNVITNNISGYPTKHDDIVIISNDPAIYTKTGSTVKYYAGYYALKYEGGWSPVFCPKVETCESYENIGPYRNKIEVRVEVNKLNNV